MEQVYLYHTTTMVGKFNGGLIYENLMSRWVRRVWNKYIGYAYVFHLSSMGYIIIVFQSKMDKPNTLVGKWYWDNSIISLNNWTPLFDPMRERLEIKLLWVKSHSLPLQLWYKSLLTLIGNRMGSIFDINEKTRSLDVTSLVKICVEINLGDGIPKGIDIQLGNHSYC
jgi:hypothetical protein